MHVFTFIFASTLKKRKDKITHFKNVNDIVLHEVDIRFSVMHMIVECEIN